jgi:hypothetical protein
MSWVFMSEKSGNLNNVSEILSVVVKLPEDAPNFFPPGE